MTQAITTTFGEPPGSGSEILRSASPALLARAGAPPFLLLHGTEDDVVPLEQSVELQSALLSHGAEASLVIVAGTAHELVPVGSIQPALTDVVARATDFLASHLGA